MENLAKRIKSARLLRGLTQVQLSALSGVKQSDISKLERGNSLKTTALVAISRALGVRADWMDTGDGVMDSSAAPQDTWNVTSASMGATRVPLISCVQAGAWTETAADFKPGDAVDWLVTDLNVSKHAFANEIKGDSMLPEFKPGDRVIIDPEVSPMPGDFVVARNGKEEATFKKYRPRGADKAGVVIFELVPLNEDFESMRSDVVTIHIVGTMVEHRKYRKTR